MGIYWQFPAGWWIVFGLVYGSVFVLFHLRKDKKKDEYIIRLKYGLAVTLLGFVIEFVGASLSLWGFNPGNWPVSVWISYFGTGLFVYEFSKYLKLWKKKK